ncbi:alpha/beta fold hydrolase [Fretibacter rubidus]|uniref:alpha/beta fold hydrolase n=1 Tax=Fretibacter rubidus TaxID=570162 RepID=UPI00352AF801
MSLGTKNHIRRAFVDSDYGQMHYRIAGKASDHNTLLCLHQSPKSSREFIRFMEVASQDRLVVAIDSPGHGESDVPDAPIGIEGYAREIWSAVDAIDLGTVDLVGHHTGAKVATEMAFQRPGDVGGIVMVSALVLSVEEREGFKSMFKPIPLDDDGTRFSHMWAQALKYRGPNVSLEMLAASMAENMRAGEAYEWGHEAAFAYNAVFEDRVSALPHRITVLNPADMLFDYTPRVGPLLQNGEVVDHPEWGSGFMDTDPVGTFNAVKKALG